MEGEAIISFRFSGGLANESQLDVYDAARFQYGAARLLYTVEVFRQTGRVPLKIIRNSVAADFRVTAAQPGSFLQIINEGAALVGPLVTDCFLKVPIKVATAYALELLFPKKATEEKAVALIKNVVDAGVELSREETKRVEIRSQENREFISLIRELTTRPNIDQPSREALDKTATALESSGNRRALIDPYRDEFRDVELEQRLQLIGQTRKQVVEIGFPLKRSADGLTIQPGTSESPISTIDITDLAALEGNIWDKDPIEFTGTIKRYDKETGWGMWRSDEFNRPVGFLVRAIERLHLQPEILAAMDRSSTTISFYVVRGPAGDPKFLVFDEFGPDME